MSDYISRHTGQEVDDAVDRAQWAVTSISVNDGTPATPDENGNVNLTVAIGADTIARAAIEKIKGKFNALIDALGNYAFPEGKSDKMKLGTFDWGDNPPAPEPANPELESPQNDVTINVGTNTGSGVSKTVFVKGSNLTKALTLIISGTGFDVSQGAINAIAANNGKTVTVSYTGTDTTAAGTLTISSSEVSVTVNLAASYSQEVTPTPTLILPAAGTTVTLPTIAATGDSSTAYITVKAENHTGSLYLSTGVSGFSVSPNSITEEEALNGKQVAITYTNQNQQQTFLTITGTLTISGGGIDPATFDLYASKEAESVTPTPTGYVTDGLVLHLNGKALSSGATSWVDSEGSKAFAFQGDAAVHLDGNNQPDGVSFSNYGDYAICSSAIDQAYDAGTIEICFTPLYGFIDSTDAAVIDDLKRMYHMRMFFMTDTDDRICAMINTKSSSKSFYLRSYGSTLISSPPSKRNLSSVPTIASTISQCYSRGMINGVLDTSSVQGAKIGRATSGTGMVVGGMITDWYVGQQGETNPRVYLANAIIHEVRIYSRLLEESEMLQNQKEDNRRYNLGITALND